jgi:hypothetical protein
VELKPLIMVGKIHCLRQPSKVSAGHAPEVRASLVVSCKMIDTIADGLTGKWYTPTTTIVVDKWLVKELPRLRAWLPHAVLNLVVPMRLSSLALDTDGCMFPMHAVVS